MSTIAHEKYEAVIGLEVHAQLLTQSKAFAPVTTEYGGAPNTQVTPLCLGHPGTLPVVNENLVRYIIKMGLATKCDVAEKSIFARKNYFYPDLPKGYQISQYDTPICFDGFVDISLEDYDKRIGITRIHMEEDAGKSIHDQDPYNTLVDLNRAGTPLIEIVSEPDLRTPQEAYAYLSKIKQIVQYLEICDGNMEEGSLRCDANVSVRPRGREKFGTRTELKNMNSFRNVERAIEYEIYRQIELIEDGGEVVQQTRLWDTAKMQTRPMRSKEEAHDYRYFPEPDLPPIIVTDEMLDEIREELPELADVRRKRFMEDFGMSEDDAVTITDSRYLADYYEEVVEHLGNPKAASNIVLSEVLRVLNEQSIDIREFSISAKRVSDLVKLKEDDKINSSAMQQIFNAMLDEDKEPEALAKEMNLIQVSDSGFLEPIVDEIIDNNPDEVARYKDGKKQLIGFFVGQAMKASRGKANPKLVKDLISKKLDD
ncbi:MAG: Asp-tRNA(Asn)/Glu-tRNA(Gln) amidotransferase subunit GatB [Gracilimonas sp.]|uniref:Asp-tRNA(Asn)/Glu-tRNA(Gln) amidotransferase subunit GatB n=1 Tax=Gracilimonas TaxID=649462 RepID=UPI001B2377BE|nr:Asp-tRNA(Asn)/Glu-tRNA(Gln) amidotransferase subunit GatB [Gracilimonas sp.]MBO6587146.1 Asp-tRNA(Asn)/Glu-tRNA(Gln) amidotransferase subunit GatB [Gracilimonas sp.]MBO6614366.1 Asp-tRNA(Asn)/Glu-tRNA(Gln) amidotransferase subunit GatB [Gracilimonas sp.]